MVQHIYLLTPHIPHSVTAEPRLLSPNLLNYTCILPTGGPQQPPYVITTHYCCCPALQDVLHGRHTHTMAGMWRMRTTSTAKPGGITMCSCSNDCAVQDLRQALWLGKCGTGCIGVQEVRSALGAHRVVVASTCTLLRTLTPQTQIIQVFADSSQFVLEIDRLLLGCGRKYIAIRIAMMAAHRCAHVFFSGGDRCNCARDRRDLYIVYCNGARLARHSKTSLATSR